MVNREHEACEKKHIIQVLKSTPKRGIRVSAVNHFHKRYSKITINYNMLQGLSILYIIRSETSTKKIKSRSLTAHDITRDRFEKKE